MSKAKGLWNTAKEAYRAAKGLLSKNERNAADRMGYRDDLIRLIFDEGVSTGIVDDIKPNATWREIMKAMMKIQTGIDK